MKNILLIAFFIFVICFFGCSVLNPSKKKQELISQSVYATKDSLELSRYDLATKYSGESVKLIPPPKKKIQIDPIYFKTFDPETKLKIKNNAIILPETATGQVIRVNSQEYNKILSENKDMRKLFQKSESDWKYYSDKVEAQRIKEIELAKKLAAEVEKEKAKNIGIMDMIKYSILIILCIPILIVILIISWIIKVALRVFGKTSSESDTSDLISPTV